MRNTLVALFFLSFACTSRPHEFMFERNISVDPDPLCHIRNGKYSYELLDLMLSVDPFGIYKDDTEVQTPYSLPEEVQQIQHPNKTQCPTLLEYL